MSNNNNWRTPKELVNSSNVTPLRKRNEKPPIETWSDASVSGTGKTSLALRTLRTGDAAICMDCAGTGQHGSCRMCIGRGVVCPSCHGMRFIRMRYRKHQPWESELARCPDCCEGNNVNPVKEMACIERYISRSDAMQTALEGETQS